MRHLVAMISCLGVFLIGGAGVASPAAPSAVLHFEAYQSKFLALRASVKGHAGLFLFDTGGGVSVVTPAFAAAVGCKPWGNIAGFRMTGERLDMPRCDDLDFVMEGQTFKAPSAGAFDINALLGPGAPAIEGSLGLDIFAERAITIDPATQTLIVESPQSLAARIKHATGAGARRAGRRRGLSHIQYRRRDAVGDRLDGA